MKPPPPVGNTEKFNISYIGVRNGNKARRKEKK
jgi:hypothetical protein